MSSTSSIRCCRPDGPGCRTHWSPARGASSRSCGPRLWARSINHTFMCTQETGRSCVNQKDPTFW